MKKFLSVLLISTLVLTSTAGCGTSSSSSSASPAAPSQGEAPNAEPPAPSGEPVTLTYVNKLTPDDITMYEAFFKRVSEAMKPLGHDITVKIESVQSGTYSEKLGLLLQSGTIPDLIYFQGGDYQFAVTQKILEDLTPYVNNSASVQASMDQFNKQRFENYPYLLWLNPSTTKVPVIREDFFNNTESGKALLEDPTVDNYYEFLKEVKEKNGTSYAYTVPGNLSELDTVFDQAFGNTSTWIKDGEGNYTYFRVSEGEKNKLEFYAKLYKEGLLDNEYLTKAWDTKERAFYDGESAIIAGTQGKVIDLYNTHSVEQNGESAKIMALPPAKGIGQGYSPVDISKESRGYAISALSEHKAEAFALLEFLTTQEGQIMDKLGEEGVQYEIVDNKIKLLPAFSQWYERLWGTTTNFNPELPFDEATPFLSPAATNSLDMATQYGTSDNVFITPPEFASKLDAVNTIYLEFASDMVTGKKTAADFDKFVKDFMDNGGKDITDYANQILE